MDSIKEKFNRYDEFVSRYDLYIWDFDLTILKIHSFANEIKEDDVKSLSWKKLMCHFTDPIFFRDLVYYLIGHKKKVAIISFGYYNVIKAYLDRLFDNDKIFDKHNIITPLDECQRHISINSDKNQYIINLAREQNISYQKILFFDDTYLNVNNARELGVSTVKISEKIGFNQSIWNEMVLSLEPEQQNNTNQNQNQKKEKESDIVFKPFDEKNQKKNIPENIIEGYSSNNGSDTTTSSNPINNFISSIYNIKISDRFVNLVNIFAVIFIIVYFYLYYFKKS
jgi:hypothetical protein